MSIINVFLCLRNNEDTLENTFKLLDDLEKYKSNYTFKYYIYENDSEDKTKELIINFIKTHKGSCIFENLKKKQWGNIQDINRVRDMSFYRNKMKNLCKDYSNSEYSIILDSNITFNINILDQMINEFQNDIVMVTPFGYVENKPSVYYDTFALDYCKPYRFFLKDCKLNKTVEINSGFGGFVVIKTSVLQKCEWKQSDKLVSEHNYFCRQVQNYGKIICARDIKVSWKK